MTSENGTRLRQLTCDLLKPVIQALGRPVMKYAILYYTLIVSILFFL